MSYGCFDRPLFKESMIVQSGWFMDGVTRTPRMQASPFRMARECQFTLTELGQVDQKCAGCTHRKEPNDAR